MLTPRFNLSQDETSITLQIRAPYSKVADAEIYVSGKNVVFHSNPYFLRLHLPGELEDGPEKATFDADQGTFTIKIRKKTSGEEFSGLDLLTDMMTPPGAWSAQPKVLECQDLECASAGGEEAEEPEMDWFFPQQLPPEESSLASGSFYGFANRRSGVFSQLSEELCMAVDIRDPDHTAPRDRALQRQQAEQTKFSTDHYLCDLFEENELLNQVLDFRPAWYKNIRKKSEVEFSDEDKDDMRDLPKNRSYNLTDTETKAAYLSLVDIMYAYAYNHRVTEGENCVESSWNITRVSATLSWLEVPTSLREVVVTSVRRSLCYPLFRSWQMALKVLEDTIAILTLGRRQILRCLLETRRILAHYSSHYILNDLYVTDYCVWVQTASFSEAWLNSLTEALKQIELQKAEVGLDLEELEAQGLADLQEEDKDDDEPIQLLVNQVNLITVDDDSDDFSDDQEGEGKDDEEEDDDEEEEDDDDEDDDDESSEETDDSVDGDAKAGRKADIATNDHKAPFPECDTQNCSTMSEVAVPRQDSHVVSANTSTGSAPPCDHGGGSNS